jgi:hypothetical protein
MKWILFVVGLVLGAIGAFATVVYAHMNRLEERDDNIVFSDKTYSDLGDESVGISGTLTGPGVGYPNNTYSISCYKKRGECWYNSIEQIGKNQVGRLDFVGSIPIRQWNAYEVIASDDPSALSCWKITITISRKTETALWVEEPINPTRPLCARADMQIHKYTIEDSPGWKRVMGRGKS